MNEYLVIKGFHILSATLLFGTGLGSAFYKWCADRSGKVEAIAHTNRIVVIADWVFTTPTIVIQPLTGLWLLHLMGLSLLEEWVLLAILLYLLAGLCWLPVVWLQIEMRNIAQIALKKGGALPDKYHRYQRYWFWLGVPAFASMIVIYFLMVMKPVLT